MRLDVNNFENYTADEYRDNLLRLGAVSHSSLVGKTVYYSQKAYGEEYEIDGWWESYHGNDLTFEPEYWMPLPFPSACG